MSSMKNLALSLLVGCLLATGAHAAPGGAPSLPGGKIMRLVRGASVVNVTEFHFDPKLPPSKATTKSFGKGNVMGHFVAGKANTELIYAWQESSHAPGTGIKAPVTLLVLFNGVEVERYTFKDVEVMGYLKDRFAPPKVNPPLFYLHYASGTYTAKAPPAPAAKVSAPGARPMPGAPRGQ